MQILIFLVILSVLVLVHELGHFLTAKKFGVYVQEFGFGLPPKVKKLFTWQGTDFTLNLLPIGGFVKLEGEDFEAKKAGPGAFFSKPVWQKAVVLLAGVTMNFVLGIVLFGAIYAVMGIPTTVSRVHITEVVAESPAEKAGLKMDDVVTSYTTSDQLVKFINDNKGKEIVLKIERNGQTQEVKITPRENPPVGQGATGIALSNVELVKYPAWQMPFRGIVVGMEEAISWGKEILGGLVTLLTQLIHGKVEADVAGPIGIYQVSAQVTKFGLLPVLQFVGVLSINLGILNLMPFPGLDGGRVVFLAIGKIIGEERKNRIEGYVHTAGMVVLFALMALITMKDIWRLFQK